MLLFFKDYFLREPFLKFLIEIVTIFLLFYALVFGHEACGILASQSGIEPAPPALEGEGSTTEPPGKSPEPLNIKWL